VARVGLHAGEFYLAHITTRLLEKAVSRYSLLLGSG
jgi:hypothetical protein